MMKAYWMARSKVNNPVEYKRYAERVPAIIKRYGGKVLARGGRFKILEGPETFQRFVVIDGRRRPFARAARARWRS
jgi:uncharacterized protein (DUF1330 family)